MIIDLSGQKALVTGSTAGIGLAIAEGLAAAGAQVTVNGRTQERVDQAVKLLQSKFPDRHIDGIAADLTKANNTALIKQKLPSVDILINNAGSAAPKDFMDLEDEDWLYMFQLNVMSGVRMTKAYLPDMIANDYGRIVFISSESALNVPKEMIDYGMTKAAQLAISRGVAEYVAGSKITVNSVLPGPTRSEVMSNWMKSTAEERGITPAEAETEFLRTMRPTTLINRFETTEEVANLVVYLSSPQASATTGTSVRVDGGVVRTIA